MNDRFGEFAFHALANAAGILIAALVLFLAGALLGVIQDVSLATFLTAIGGLVAASAATFAAYRYTRGFEAQMQAKAAQDLERLRSVLTPEEAFAISGYANAGASATTDQWLAYAEAATNALGRLIERDEEQRKRDAEQEDEDD